MSYGWFGLLSIVVTLIGYLPYGQSLLKGHTKPHCFSWFLWGLNAFIIYFTQESGGAGPGAWAALLEGFMCGAVCLFAVKYGEHDITRCDVIALCLALGGIVLSLFVKSAYPAMVLCAVVDCMAFYPTIRKSWKKPDEEELSIYVITAFGCLLSMLALVEVNMLSMGNLVVLLVTQIGFVAMVMARRASLNHQRPAHRELPMPEMWRQA